MSKHDFTDYRKLFIAARDLHARADAEILKLEQEIKSLALANQRKDESIQVLRSRLRSVAA